VQKGPSEEGRVGEPHVQGNDRVMLLHCATDFVQARLDILPGRQYAKIAIRPGDTLWHALSMLEASKLICDIMPQRQNRSIRANAVAPNCQILSARTPNGTIIERQAEFLERNCFLPERFGAYGHSMGEKRGDSCAQAPARQARLSLCLSI
jgi:hypothetical protein